MARKIKDTEKIQIQSLKGGRKLDVGFDREKEYKLFKQEISRKASMANKRLKRLESNNLTDLPAYQQWLSYNGGVKFGVKGKTHNELQKELARLNRFLDSKTSLVRESNKLLKSIAEDTGIKYGSVRELPQKTKRFFELVSKTEQYLRNVEGSASAIGYQKLWEVVSNYVKSTDVDLGSSKFDMEKALQQITELSKYENVEKGFDSQTKSGKWYNISDGVPFDDL